MREPFFKIDLNMKKIFSLIVALLFVGSVSATGEDKIEAINFGVEVGAHVLTKDVEPPSNVRFGKYGVHAYYIPWHIGVLGEYMFGNGMFGLSTGLRLTTYTAFLGREGEFSYEWNVDPDAEKGEYVSITSIKQANNYLGVPLQFRILFVKPDNIVRPYFKLDLSFCWLVANRNTISFTNEDEPARYIDIINENLGDPEKFSSTLDFAYGLRIGRDPFYVNAEIHFPSFLLTSSPVSFFGTSDLTMLNFGAKIALQVPVYWTDYVEKKKHNGKTAAQRKEEKIQQEYIPTNDFENVPNEDDSNGEFTPEY